MPTTQQNIDNAIAAIAAIADSLPGVVIIHDMRDWTIAWMSNRGLGQLNLTLKQITGLTSEEYHGRYFNPEDAKDYSPKMLAFLEKDEIDATCNLFQQVRVNNDADWTWHFSSTKVYLRDDANKPLLAMTTAYPIDGLHHMTIKAARLLNENNFLRKNLKRFAKLTDREREVLRLMALGKSSVESAHELFITPNTVETHRKNIRQKLDVSSYFDLSEYARAFNLI